MQKRGFQLLSLVFNPLKKFASSFIMTSKKREISSATSSSLSSSKRSRIAENEAVDEELSEEELQLRRGDEVRGEDGKRLPKRKFAFAVGYIGTNYSGSQVNPGAVTIESKFFDALHDVAAVSHANYERPQKVQFGRTSRTDKGVHAIANVFHLKAVQRENLVEKLNAVLPDDIKVFGFRSVTKQFKGREDCSMRTYEFVLPTYTLKRDTSRQAENFKIETHVLERAREVLKCYEGTRRYHNFTTGKAFNDKSSNRHILSVDCSDPFVLNDIEFVSIILKGQSFLLNQIRKMVGAMVQVVRDQLHTGVLLKCFEDKEVQVALAPGLGLILRQCHFDWYQKTKGEKRGDLNWSEEADEMEKFRADVILPHIAEMEKRGKVYLAWSNDLRSLNENLLLGIY